MNSNRRDFLKGTFWMGAAAMAAGCQLNRFGFGEGGQMQNFALKPMKRVKVGFVGIGGRGSAAVRRISKIPGVDIVALCDLSEGAVQRNLRWLKDNKYPDADKIRPYVGPEAYKDLCDFGACDVVYCATPWALHQPVGLRALFGGKIALIEVTSALTVDQCWELVEASEKMKVPCMQLENCIYGEIELLELKLARMGMFGEINHVEGGYIHDLRSVIPQAGWHNEWIWRYDENMVHRGDRYPTHGLVPLCQTLGVNRGDRLDYLVALGSGLNANRNYELVKKEYLPDSDSRKFDPPAAMAEMNTTLIKTVKGVSIMIQHDVSSPRPYNRLALVSGTRGIMADYPFRCTFEKKSKERKTFVDESGKWKVPPTHSWFSKEEANEIRTKYEHPLWRAGSEIGKRLGERGHGGMDFIMDLRWAYCLQNGLPLDMDVYDLAATSCLCELTEKSDRSGSMPQSIPDFTRGNWKNVQPWGIVDIDLKKMGLDKGDVKKDNAAIG